MDMKRLIICLVVIFSIICLLISCAPILTPGQERIKRVIDDYEQVKLKSTYSAEEKVQVAQQLLDIVLEYEDILYRRQAISYSAEDAIRGLKSDTTHEAASLLFAAGEQYKNEGQIEKSKQVYKMIISTFIGTAYGAYRERARMEIDDLRSQ